MSVLARPVATGGRSRPRRPRAGLRHFLLWHPEWWVYAVAGAAWIALLDRGTEMAGHTHPASASWSAHWSHWLLMVLAMMLPVSARHVRMVGLRSVWSRRHRSSVSFVLGFVALFAVAGAALVTVVLMAGLELGAADLLVVALLLAAAWQASVPRRRLVRRCSALKLGAATGLAGDVDCARAGVRSAARCLAECWPAMIAMALSHNLLLMAGLTVVLLSERTRGANPERRAGRPLEAWALAGFAAVAALGLL